MLTREIREWLYGVKRNQYSYKDAMEKFMRLAPFLTREEMRLIKKKLEEFFN